MIIFRWELDDFMKVKHVSKTIRVMVNFNTGTRIHRPKKGKGSYQRNNKYKGGCNNVYSA